LEQVTCTLSADGVIWVEQIDELKPGEYVKFTKRTSDLYLESLEYRVRGASAIYEEGGIACTCETLVIEIGDHGVSTSYR